ncbi:hypothetical protein [Dechloromonas sp. A34]|uniref:hypothetical protein n=1 Tax=Dechloromonas sp. A34 TaxID=447588 RepID=UPI0022487C29|nr:hypothetical protein [Dechloromonas sp. A34]
MSLSWLDRLSLLVAPQAVVLERRSWRGRHERFSAPVRAAGGDEAAWLPGLTASAALLAEHAAPHCRLQVTVANPFVRYALLPWSEAVLGDKARLAMARALLRNSLGDQAERLEITLDRPRFGMNGLAAGIPRDFLDGLRQIANERRLRLASIQPLLGKALRDEGADLNDGFVAFPEAGWLTLVGLQGGNLRLLRNHRADTAPGRLADELLGILTTESGLIERRRLAVFSPEAWPESIGDWRVECRPSLAKGGAHA